jgi:hypothetical protein
MVVNFLRLLLSGFGHNREEPSLKQRLIAVHIGTATPRSAAWR